jgi:hypothetical protein
VGSGSVCGCLRGGRRDSITLMWPVSGWWGGRKYERFDEHAERATAEWSSLVITAKKLPSSRVMKAYHGNGECPICFEDFTASSWECTLKCQHAFHRECVMEWGWQGNTCTMCRDLLERTELREILRKTPARHVPEMTVVHGHITSVLFCAASLFEGALISNLALESSWTPSTKSVSWNGG